MDRLLEEGRTCPLYLKQPDLANILVNAIRYRDPAEYQLHAWVVMANHVHILITPNLPIPKIMHSLKRFTAREANRHLGLTNHPFWQEESFDRLVRSKTEFNRIKNYIETNPVKAGLSPIPETYPWSSATQPTETCRAGW